MESLLKELINHAEWSHYLKGLYKYKKVEERYMSSVIYLAKKIGQAWLIQSVNIRGQWPEVFLGPTTLKKITIMEDYIRVYFNDGYVNIPWKVMHGVTNGALRFKAGSNEVLVRLCQS